MDDAPDIAGEDITPDWSNPAPPLGPPPEEQNGQASDDGMPEPPWVTEGRDPTNEEKLDVLAGTIEYHDEQIAEIREACSQMARVLVRLVQAVDGATGPAKVYGPDGQPLNRKQRRDIEFGRGA